MGRTIYFREVRLRGEPGERRAHIALDDGEDFLAVIRDPESLVVTLITEAESDG